ncbi:MAG: SDR family NAD(P)-dependent oxidoreductase, partial [Hyphomicrobiales bacterium]|nr:SDR family NAD(P)-dependent oxidoreductase [Hyphomicrobiales bacterium]
MGRSQPAVANKTPALITGASGGIGADLARVFARHGHPVALAARNRDRLEALAIELQDTTGIHATVSVCDLEQPDAAPALLADLERQGFSTGILVNNAGFGL